MARRDWLLSALAAAGDSGLSPVQVQKTMFLFWKGAERSLDPSEFYLFTPYNFGPFDAQIYTDLERMEATDWVRIFNPYSGANRLYVITRAGEEQAARAQQADASAASYIFEVVQWVKRKSFSELLRTIYRKWPEYRRNSIFVDRQ
jgi:hypothetical protein